MLMNIRCNYCRGKLDKKWNFCPRCGSQINKRITMFDILRRQMDVLRNLMLRGDEYEPRIQQPRNAITIRIDSRGSREPQVRVFPKPIPAAQEEPYQGRRPERRLTGKIIEPKTHIKRLAKEILITIPLPGVKSDGDVELNVLSDSVEVRAFAGDKGYFKILNIPKNHRLVEKTLSDGKLNLKFTI